MFFWNTVYMPYLCRLRDTIYWSKGNYRMVHICRCRLRDCTVISFESIPACDRRSTDRWTDRQTACLSRSSVASLSETKTYIYIAYAVNQVIVLTWHAQISCTHIYGSLTSSEYRVLCILPNVLVRLSLKAINLRINEKKSWRNK